MRRPKLQVIYGNNLENLEFLVWKDDQLSFYAKPVNGDPRVVQLKASLPEIPAFEGQPFPDCAPKKILPCVLLPPRILLPTQVKKVSLKTRKNCLFEKDDTHVYSEHIKKKKIVLKRRITKIQSLIESTQDPIQVTKLENELNGVSEQLDRFKNMTVKKMRQEAPNVLYDHLIQGWALKYGYDLKKLSSWRVQLLEWLESIGILDAPPDHDDSIHGDNNLQKYLARNDPSPCHRDYDTNMLKKWPDGLRDDIWRVLEKVSYRIEFENNEIRFLFNVEVRIYLRPEEVEELNRISDGPMSRKGREKIEQAECILNNNTLIPDLATGMDSDEKKLFSLLIQPKPYSPKPLSYVAIGQMLECSKTTVINRKNALIRKYPQLEPYINQARMRNSKKTHPKNLPPPKIKQMDVKHSEKLSKTGFFG